jgi:hypothetical protein
LTEVRALLTADSRFRAGLDGDDQYRTDGATLDLTDETVYQRTYRITAPASLAEGTAVYATKGTDALLGSGKVGERTWTDMALGGRRRSDTITCDLHPIREDEENVSVDGSKRQSQHVVEGYFRGQVFAVNTKVTLHLLPDLIATYKPSPTGAVRIQTSKSKFQNVELRIVLDASGSMCMPEIPGTPFNPKVERRYDRALAALRSALKGLPPGVNVGLRVFSHKGKNQESELYWKPKRWEKDDLDNLADRVRALRDLVPYHQTPLVRTMIEAKNDFTPGFSGTKLLLVLTDGGDSTYRPGDGRLEEDMRANFPKSAGIQLDVIAFETGGGFPTELEEANAKRMKPIVEKLGGTYRTAEDGGTLTAFLEGSLRFRYTIQDEDGHAIKGANITRSVAAENPEWVGLRDGYYWIRPQFGEGRFSEGVKFQIDRGDYLAVNLFAKDSDFIFQRDVWSKKYWDKNGKLYKESANKVGANWVGAIVQNSLTDKGRLQLMAALERSDNPEIVAGSKDSLRQFSPRIVFFDVKPSEPNDGRFRSLRIDNLNQYAAPAWNLVVKNWPDKDEPPPVSVDVWWSNPKERFGFEQLLFGSNLEIDDVNQKLRNLKGTMAESVIVQSVRVEEEEQGNGQLVVRLRYPKDKHFMVRLVDAAGDDSKYAGNPCEHRFYTEAGKYTGRFFGWKNERFRDASKNLALELISVEEFKKEAQARKNYLHFDLDGPTLAAERPRPETPPDVRIGPR